MDSYDFVSPDAAMNHQDLFGDDEHIYMPADLATTFDPDMFLGDLSNMDFTLMPNESVFPDPFALTAAPESCEPFMTPPQTGFDGYLAGNVDFSEALLPSNDFAWGLDPSTYNQDFAMMTGVEAAIPPPPSSTTESYQQSPVDNVYLPYTPPEAPAFESLMFEPLSSQASSSTGSSPSSTSTNSPPKNDTQASRKASLGPKRQLRKLIKPETCPVCGKGHAQLRERDRHIITQHYDVAVQMGLNVQRAQCDLCEQSFRRKDHLTRHMKRRHGY